MAHGNGNEINSKRSYWLKLSSQFFGNVKVKKLRRLDCGDALTIIYLKMMLLGIENGGVLEYEGVEDSIEQELALKLDEDESKICAATDFLLKQGILKRHSENLRFSDIGGFIGSETRQSVYRRGKRSVAVTAKSRKRKEQPDAADQHTFCAPEIKKAEALKDLEEEQKAPNQNYAAQSEQTCESNLSETDLKSEDLLCNDFEKTTSDSRKTSVASGQNGVVHCTTHVQPKYNPCTTPKKEKTKNKETEKEKQKEIEKEKDKKKEAIATNVIYKYGVRARESMCDAAKKILSEYGETFPYDKVPEGADMKTKYDSVTHRLGDLRKTASEFVANNLQIDTFIESLEGSTETVRLIYKMYVDALSNTWFLRDVVDLAEMDRSQFAKVFSALLALNDSGETELEDGVLTVSQEDVRAYVWKAVHVYAVQKRKEAYDRLSAQKNGSS